MTRKPPLQPQFVPVSLAGGIDAQSDTNQVVPPMTLQASNIRYTSTGAVRPRPGALTGPTVTAAGAVALAATNNELIATDLAGNLYGYSSVSSTWVNRGQATPYSMATLNISRIASAIATNLTTGTYTNNLRNISCAQIGNIGIAVWDNGVAPFTNMFGNTVFISCYDVISGKVYWVQTTQGDFPTGTYRYYGNGALTNATFTGMGTNVPNGALAPTIITHQGNFVFCMQSCVATTDTVAAVSGYAIITNAYYFPCDGVNVPPIINFSAGNCTRLGGAVGSPFPWYCTIVPTVAISGAWGGSSTTNPQTYYDVASNGTNLFLGGVGISYSSTSGTVLSTSVGAFPAMNGLVVTGASFTLSNIMTPTVVPVTTGTGPGPISIAGSTSVTNNFAVVGPARVYSANMTSGSFGTAVTLPASYTAFPTSAGFTSTALWASDGITTYSMPHTSGTLTGAYVSYATSVDMFKTASASSPTPPALDPLSASPLYSRMVWLTEPSTGTLQPYAWLATLGQYGSLVLSRLNTTATAPTPPVARGFYLRYTSMTGLQGNISVHAGNLNVVGNSLVTAIPVVTNLADNVSSLTQVTLTANTATQIVRLPQGALVTGSDTRYYDGNTTRSSGWLAVPATPSIGQISAASLLLPNQTYQYCVILADYDQYGNAIYSSPSAIVSWLTSSSTSNAVILSNLTNDSMPRLSNFGRLYIYRNSAGGGTTPGTQYYRVAAFALSATAATILQLPVVPATWTDTTAENIVGNTLLYSPPNGGELPNDPAPPSTCAVATKSRVFVASAEVGSWLYPSKPFYPGRAPEFNAGQYLDIDPSSGPIIGLAALDENIIIFKSDRVYVLSGNGPDATGNGSFNPPQNLSIDTGLLDPKSIVTTEAGVYFRSTRGLQLLNRSLQLNWVGQNIDGYLNGTNATVTSAAVDAPTCTVRFSLSTGPVLVYDYTNQVWSTYSYAHYNNGTSLYVQSMAMDPTQKNLWISWFATVPAATNGIAYEPTLNITSFVDGATNVNATVQSGHVQLAGPLGYGRARRCNIYGTIITPGVNISIFFIYDNGSQTSSQIVYTLPGATPNVPFAVRVRVPRQICRTISVRIVMSTATEACVISGVEFETLVKSGALRTADAASI
jgi:hypothetical protein